MSPRPAETRRLVGRYRLDAELGRGAMGTVWSAYDEVLHRPVAVKEVRLSLVPVSERAIVRERTLREARATAMLSHPNVVTLYDVVEVDSEPYVVMELLPSRSLASYIAERGTLSQAETAEIGSAVASALMTAHRAGITHRDVKPGNVLIGTDGQIKLTDFGIARNAAESSMTQTGTVLGSPPYIAPEVAMGRAVGPPADLWGLGATLFACLEGRPPYDAGDPVSTVSAVVHGEIPRPKGHGPVVDVVRGLMVKDPGLRMPLPAVRRRLRPLMADPEGPMLSTPPSPATTEFRLPQTPSDPPAGDARSGLIPAQGRSGTLVEGAQPAGPSSTSSAPSPAPRRPSPTPPAARTAPLTSAPPDDPATPPTPESGDAAAPAQAGGAGEREASSPTTTAGAAGPGTTPDDDASGPRSTVAPAAPDGDAEAAPDSAGSDGSVAAGPEDEESADVAAATPAAETGAGSATAASEDTDGPGTGGAASTAVEADGSAPDEAGSSAPTPTTDGAETDEDAGDGVVAGAAGAAVAGAALAAGAAAARGGTASDRTESDRTESDRTESDRTESDRTESDRTESDSTGSDSTGTHTADEADATGRDGGAGRTVTGASAAEDPAEEPAAEGSPTNVAGAGARTDEDAAEESGEREGGPADPIRSDRTVPDGAGDPAGDEDPGDASGDDDTPTGNDTPTGPPTSTPPNPPSSGLGSSGTGRPATPSSGTPRTSTPSSGFSRTPTPSSGNAVPEPGAAETTMLTPRLPESARPGPRPGPSTPGAWSQPYQRPPRAPMSAPMRQGAPQALAADPGPLPFATARRPGPAPSRTRRIGIVVLVVVLALAGLVGGYVAARLIGGQPAFSVSLAPEGPVVDGERMVSHSDDNARYSGTGMGFTALVPSTWQQFRLQQPGGDIVVRYVSDDADRELRIDRLVNFYPAQHAAGYAALLAQPSRTGADAVRVEPLTVVAPARPGAAEPVQQTVYRARSGTTDDRTTWTRLIPSGADLWVIRMTAPSTSPGAAPQQFAVIADSFTPPV